MHPQSNTIIRVCVTCGKEFTPDPRNVASGKGFNCSKACGYAAIRARKIPVEERFWRHVQKTESCWIWTGSLARGHGQILVGVDEQGKRVKEYVHRLSWRMHCGPIPEGMEVCHNCPGGDNPACVNPEHLFLGTHADNMHDGWKKGQIPRGEKHGHARITADDVRAIRARYAAGGISHRLLGLEYGYSQGSIRAIVIRKTWRHVD